MVSYYQTLRKERKFNILDSELIFRGKQVLSYTNQLHSENVQWKGCSNYSYRSLKPAITKLLMLL